MKLIIDNVEFTFDFGCRVLKLKHKNSPYKEIEDFWDDIVPPTFTDILKLQNLEQRRIGILYLGVDNIVKSVNPKLVSKETIGKKTKWINENGELVTHNYLDTYELYEVDGKFFTEGLQNANVSHCYYVRCKDTSTDREYLIWVDINSVGATNDKYRSPFDDVHVDAIDCIAWTIQTNVPIGNIKEIIRQGDCILIKPKGEYEPLQTPRHLTKSEYLSLISAES
jgi:hypothetical protein